MRRRRAASMAVVLAVVVAACSGEGDSAADPDTEAEDPAVEATTEPESEPEPEPTEEPPVVYEVQSGDTLSAIARDFDVTLEDLIEANDIEDPDVLEVGQELVIP